MSAPLHTVHVRVNDAATGQPTPVRIRFTGPGEYYAPFGRLTEFATEANVDVGGNLQLGDKRFAYIDGTCEIQLPADSILVEVSKGPEYTPLRQETQLGPGKMTLRLSLQRWVNMREQGWYSGDTCAFFLTPHAALLEGAAEDVAVVNVLILEWPGWPVRFKGLQLLPAIPNILTFSGQVPALEMPGHLVVVNTLNYGGKLGILGLLNCHRIVYPLSLLRSAGHRLTYVHDWTLADWCDQCHRKGGLVMWLRSDFDMPKSLFGEALADLILGKVDALEVRDLNWCQGQHSPWYGLLNCGFRVPLVGGSHKGGNGSALGQVRTYARLLPGEGFNYQNWIEAVRAGRTFVTNGPLLSFTVNGQDPGAIIDLPAAGQTVHVRVEARSILSFNRLELVLNGVAVAGTEASGSPVSAILETDLRLSAGGWLAARCWDQSPSSYFSDRVAAHTSPIYIQLAGQLPQADPIAVALFLDHLDKMLQWVQTKAGFENVHQRERLAGIFQSARQELLKRSGSAPNV